MQPIGQFGTRLMGGKDVAATRYIFSLPSPEARDLFDRLDEPLLNYLDDDGKSIEPEYYVPTLPTVLINGTEGIGTGFSCSIPPFNVSDIKKNIDRVLKGEAPESMDPWFRGFKGTIKKENPTTWTATGVWSQPSSRCVAVTELPPGRWTQDYKEHLDTLVEKKLISDFKNNSTPEAVDFKIYDYSGKDLVKDLKLQKVIRTSNMHLFHPATGIKKYETAEDILVDFVAIRLDFYKRRKAHLIESLTGDTERIESKARFVRMVVDDELVIFKRKRADLEAELARLGFETVDGSYDHLLHIKTYQYTEEAIAEMLAEVERKRGELAVLKKTRVVDMWKSDILKINCD
jgi:DNA topoisomerase-2